MKTMLSLAALFLVSTLVQADDIKTKLTSDQQCCVEAIACSVTESRFAEKAAKAATTTEVRELARDIVSEHKEMNKSMLERAKDMKVAVVEGLDKDKREELADLSKKEGKDFDRAYLKGVIERHEKAIKKAKEYAKDGSDKDMKACIDKNLPTLEKHLKEAKRVLALIKE